MQSLVPGRDFQSSMNLMFNEVIKKFVGVFVTASDDFFFFFFLGGELFGKNCLCYPCLSEKGSLLA